MFDLEDMKQYGSIGLILVSIFSIFVSGLFFAGSYYVMGTVQTAFESSDCVIEDNLYVDSCQDLWELGLYPILEMREILIWVSFFFIFGLVAGMLVIGYQSGKSPALLGLLITFIAVLTYLGIHISNIYRTLLDSEVLRDMLVDFTVYNKIMLNFPWFVFFVGVLATILSIVNYQKTPVNEDREVLNF